MEETDIEAEIDTEIDGDLRRRLIIWNEDYGGFAKEKEIPWQVSLINDNHQDEVGQTMMGGGVLLSSTKILTAAHFLYKDTKLFTDWIVKVGHLNLDSADLRFVQERDVKQIFIHP